MAFRLKIILLCMVCFWSCANEKAVRVQSNAVTVLPVRSHWGLQTAQPQAIEASIPADANMEKQLAPLRAEMELYTQRVLGRLSQPLLRGKPESTMGNFVSDAMRSQVKSTVGIEPDFCFTNLGGLRIDLPAGEVTAGQVTELMPFDNAIVIFRSSGLQTQELIERIAQRGDPASGLTYRLPGRNFEINGVPVRHDKTYQVCTNDYVFGGGSNYPIHKETAATYTGVLLREAIEQAFLKSDLSIPVVGQRVLPSIGGP